MALTEPVIGPEGATDEVVVGPRESSVQSPLVEENLVPVNKTRSSRVIVTQSLVKTALQP
jgi:hypothetical protein